MPKRCRCLAAAPSLSSPLPERTLAEAAKNAGWRMESMKGRCGNRVALHMVHECGTRGCVHA